MADIGTSVRIPSSGNGSVPTVSTGITVGNTSTLVLADAPGRIHAILVNDSDEKVYLNLIGGDAVIGKGYMIAANGGIWCTSVSGLYTHKISAICASGGKNLCLTYAGQ